MATTYWVGGEDVDMRQDTGGWAVVTTNSGGSTFRSTFARCSLVIGQNSSPLQWIENQVQWGPIATFWFGGRLAGPATVAGVANVMWLGLVDSSRILRLGIYMTAVANAYQLKKVDAAGTTTNLGSTFTVAWNANLSNKFDWYVDDGVSGTIRIYINGSLLLTYTGDTTTDGVSTLGGFRLGYPSNSGASTTGYSELVVSDYDTRSQSVFSMPPVANGNTHNFDTGTPAAANVNEIAINDATIDGSTTAGQIDQYTVPAIPAGTFSILAIGVVARSQKGASGPTKLDLNVRSGGNDFFSVDKVQDTAMFSYSNVWSADPNTSAAWAALPTNIGLKSVA